MEENKKEIVGRLSILLKATRAGWDMDRLKLSEDQKEVLIIFRTGFVKRVNIECDSGVEVIKDVIRGLM